MSEPWFKEGLRFKCTGCGKCCTGSPGYVFISASDLDALSEHLQLPKEEFIKRYTYNVDGHLSLIDSPESDACIFLDKDKCSVYEARPIQCRTFPWWLHNLRTPEEWKATAERCEGVNHPDAPIVPGLEIETQCLSYLDSLLDQNFDSP